MTDLIGLPIKLERTSDGVCAACGGTVVVNGRSSGPHCASQRCASCHRHRGWLPKPRRLPGLPGGPVWTADLSDHRPQFCNWLRTGGARGGSVNSTHDPKRMQ